MRVKIDVTGQDIAAGRPGSPCHCPVALATARATQMAAIVNGVQIALTTREAPFRSIYLRSPKSVHEFIATFDSSADYHKSKPFSFEIELPDAEAPCAST